MNSFTLVVISLCFAVLLFAAVLHKVRNFAKFQAILADYQILPLVLVPSAAVLIVVVEALLMLCWLLPALSNHAGLGTAMLFTVYAFSMATNLLRGRLHISCGCGGASEQLLSWYLVARNAVLIGVALAVLPDAAPWPLAWHDMIAAVSATAAFSLLYLAASQTLTNANTIKLWVGADD